MPREIRLNAFAMNTVGHLSPGLWTHPRDRSTDYAGLGLWTGLAKTLERGLFDGFFMADVVGVYDVYKGSAEAAIRAGAQVPVNDPLQVVPAMATVTEHLGFGITCSVSFEHPYVFARRMSTLDHLTRGRAGWNIVTSYLDSGARNLGQARQTGHDDRYDIADEFLDVCYKLWEGSWEDGAVLRDRASGRYADPAKVHPIAHQGRHYTVPGIHLCEPSPQRTPVLYQAGASARGQVFAARHAECVFVGAPSRVVLKKLVSGIRAAVAAQGRDPHDVTIFSMQTVIVDDTDRQAQEKYAEFRRHVSLDGAFALLSGWTGIDLAQFAPDEALRYIRTDAAQSMVAGFTSADPDRVWTAREAAEWCGIGGRGPVVAGSPATVADHLLEIVAECDVDGFNLAFALMPETFEDFVRLVVPELQSRGVYKTTYAPGTLRDKLFGAGPLLSPRHYGAQFRRG